MIVNHKCPICRSEIDCEVYKEAERVVDDHMKKYMEKYKALKKLKKTT